MILLRKFEVALVVTRYAEQRTGSVIHQHEIRDVDGQPPLRIEWMHNLDPCRISLLHRRLDLGGAGASGFALSNEVSGFRIG